MKRNGEQADDSSIVQSIGEQLQGSAHGGDSLKTAIEKDLSSQKEELVNKMKSDLENQ